MRHTVMLKKRLAFVRFLHLLLMFIAAMFFFLFSNLPHAWWILVTTLAVSSSIEPGIIFGNSIHRIRGTLFALILLLPLLYILQLNYRFIPVIFILIIVGFNVTALNFKRYDITVFFNTLAIVFLLAETTDILTPEGPIEVVINRGLSTIIGILIIIFADYMLFNSYSYSQKLYLLHQMNTYNFLRDIAREVWSESSLDANKFLLISKFRRQVNEIYKVVATSAENLKKELKISPALKNEIDTFQTLIWEARRSLFAIAFSKLLVKDEKRAAIHLERYRQLLAEMRKNFIKIERDKQR